MGCIRFLRFATEIAEAGIRVAGVLVVMAIDTQQLPIAAIRWVIVMIVVAVVDRQLLQVFRVELARAATADPGIHFQRPATVTSLALVASGTRLGNYAIKLIRRVFRRHLI